MNDSIIILELFKSFDEILLDLIALILNFVYQKGIFPQKWAADVVVILHKDGDTNDSNNYHGYLPECAEKITYKSF